MARRRLSAGEAAELLELDARLERLKIGIGGAVITLVSSGPGTPELAEAEDRLERATGEALAVRARILELRPPLPAPTAPVTAIGEPGAPPVVVASAEPSHVARHVNVYVVSASSPPSRRAPRH
jgi:hypothetical protein